MAEKSFRLTSNSRLRLKDGQLALTNVPRMPQWTPGYSKVPTALSMHPRAAPLPERSGVQDRPVARPLSSRASTHKCEVRTSPSASSRNTHRLTRSAGASSVSLSIPPRRMMLVSRLYMSCVVCARQNSGRANRESRFVWTMTALRSAAVSPASVEQVHSITPNQLPTQVRSCITQRPDSICRPQIRIVRTSARGVPEIWPACSLPQEIDEMNARVAHRNSRSAYAISHSDRSACSEDPRAHSSLSPEQNVKRAEWLETNAHTGRDNYAQTRALRSVGGQASFTSPDEYGKCIGLTTTGRRAVRGNGSSVIRLGDENARDSSAPATSYTLGSCVSSGRQPIISTLVSSSKTPLRRTTLTTWVRGDYVLPIRAYCALQRDERTPTRSRLK
jgi:hypothetical protein